MRKTIFKALLPLAVGMMSLQSFGSMPGGEYAGRTVEGLVRSLGYDGVEVTIRR